MKKGIKLMSLSSPLNIDLTGAGLKSLVVKLCSCVLFFNAFLGFSQGDVKKEFEISVLYGNASVQIDRSKSVGFFTGMDVKKEFSLGDKYSILAGLAVKEFNLNASQLNVNAKYAGLPVSFRYYLVNNDKALFAEFGTYVNYLYKSEYFNNSSDLETRFRNSGNNYGVFYKLGYAVAFNDAFKVNLALSGGQDFATSMKSEVPDVKIKNQVGIELGLGINLFK